MNWFKDKKVLITGGSSGIGKAAAVFLAQWGAELCIVARNEVRLKRACEDIRLHTIRRDQKVICRSLDVSDRQSIFEKSGEIIESLGGLDILINSAGVAWPGYIRNKPDNVWDETLAVNYTGTLNCIRALLPHFMENKSGRIANVNSFLGFMGLFGYSAYSASKFAVKGLSESLRQDLLPFHIKVSVFYPPDTDTPLYHAENKIKPAETRALAGNIKVISPEKAAYALLRGIAKGRFTIIPGIRSKCIYRMQLWFPSLFRWLLDRQLGQILKAPEPKESTFKKSEHHLQFKTQDKL
jgi:3-dehydrosphinganine reductase